MTCSKPFTLTIDPDVSCPDWGTLLWAAPVVVGESPPDAVFSFTPNAAAGASYVAAADVVDFFSGGLLLLQASVNASLTYNGGGCNCKVTVVFAGTGDPTEAEGTIDVLQDGVSVIGGQQNFDSSTGGSFEFPFTLIDTGGTPEAITVVITVECNNLSSGGPASVDMSGTFSNV